MTATALTNKVDGKPITVSPSMLMDFVKSPHLFWLDRNLKLGWPRGAFPSLPGGMDGALKDWYDKWRITGLPPEVRAQGLTGRPHPDQKLVSRLRTKGKNGMTPITVTQEVGGKVYTITFQGQIDDLLLEANGDVSVYDYKTKGSGPKPGDTEKYYEKQGDGYALLFLRNGLKPSGKGHFAYYHSPEVACGAENGPVEFTFRAEVVHVTADAGRAELLIQNIIKCLAGPLPPRHLDLEQEAPAYLDAYEKAVAGERVPA